MLKNLDGNKLLVNNGEYVYPILKRYQIRKLTVENQPTVLICMYACVWLPLQCELDRWLTEKEQQVNLICRTTDLQSDVATRLKNLAVSLLIALYVFFFGKYCKMYAFKTQANVSEH